MLICFSFAILSLARTVRLATQAYLHLSRIGSASGWPRHGGKTCINRTATLSKQFWISVIKLFSNIEVLYYKVRYEININYTVRGNVLNQSAISRL